MATQAMAIYFRPSEEPKDDDVRARVPTRVKKSVERLVEVWGEVDRAITGNKTTSVSESSVILRLLEIGLDGAWDEIGFAPKSDEDLAKVKELAIRVFSEASGVRK